MVTFMEVRLIAVMLFHSVSDKITLYKGAWSNDDNNKKH